jgi:hypothetical protein
MDITMPWLSGVTGYGFIICIEKGLCPSSPYFAVSGVSTGHPEGCSDKVAELGKNAGYIVNSIIAWGDDKDQKEKMNAAWEMVKEAIDKGNPCYGYGFGDEYAIICGYDKVGYYVGNNAEGPQAWDQLGGFELFKVSKGTKADDRTTVKAGLQFALEHAQSSPKLIPGENYKSGLAAYDNWIHAVETGTADTEDWGMGLNSNTWMFCRHVAVLFIKEAKAKLGKETELLFDEAEKHYIVVRDNLAQVARQFSSQTEKQHTEFMKDEGIRAATVGYLKAAKAAEEKGLEALEKIVGQL